MRSISSVCLCCALLLGLSGLCYAAEKDELALEWRALVAEWNVALKDFQMSSPAYKALKDFQGKLDQRGYTFDKSGQVIEKPKPKPPEPKAETPKK